MKDEIKVMVEITTPNARLPKYATEGSAGMDLYCIDDGYVPPMERKLISTGLKMAIPVGYEGQIRPRSSLALKYGVTVLNAPGTIDSDYRGTIQVLLMNLSDMDFYMKRGDRIAQIVFAKVAQIGVAVVHSLPTTDRGEGGFGSTGR